MKLIIVRHGETVDNLKGVIQGQTQGELTNVGLEQAKKLAIRLKDENIDLALSSDLKRALDTAQEILVYHPTIKFNVDPELRERSFGVFEGLYSAEYDQFKNSVENGDLVFRPENGETGTDVRKRAFKFVNKLLKMYPDKTVLLVTHGGWKGYFFSKLLFPEVPFQYIKFDNTAVSIIELFANKNHKIYLVNCTKHLD